ncbi:helix-turn-helix domain-containing protein [Staphylococcus shinii]|jgi:transcriptional regulator with XRE-family HTH domain|uniref:Cupin domain-containing protein n=2 Tax=Staphylococcus shinii TaxID=2912228 RepID=A0A418IH93_9STAP|nr:cupin domain-containing protein [Staphylococcus shinii]MDW8563606.1 cupin domain-containing protein [Staphylococcus shinii]MDW8566846.1 cupin domain-containing protein [Staphylococcus shinii]MDW8574314.1 cupin domain-containing protein [Staphylococcus shinii]RIN01963.1 cupin domain-containing protein [Staphylococcus shinii]RIN10201.1 cupin domain-containing protein [Staphylococcus shinii]
MDNEIQIGQKLRNIRKEKKITINKLAKDTGFTPSFISQFERGLTSASISTLKKITDALSMNLTMLLNEDEELQYSPFTYIVRKGEYKKLAYPDEKSTDYMITRDKAHYEVIYSEIKPGGDSGETLSHNSIEETITILQGLMEIKINGETYNLDVGDSISFCSQHPHSWKNIGDNTLKIIWVVYPPTY